MLPHQNVKDTLSEFKDFEPFHNSPPNHWDVNNVELLVNLYTKFQQFAKTYFDKGEWIKFLLSIAEETSRQLKDNQETEVIYPLTEDKIETAFSAFKQLYSINNLSLSSQVETKMNQSLIALANSLHFKILNQNRDETKLHTLTRSKLMLAPWRLMMTGFFFRNMLQLDPGSTDISYLISLDKKSAKLVEFLAMGLQPLYFNSLPKKSMKIPSKMKP